jgi:hypothetical protein
MVIGFERRETFIPALQPIENDMPTTLHMHFDLMTVYRRHVGKRPLARPSEWMGDNIVTGEPTA